MYFDPVTVPVAPRKVSLGMEVVFYAKRSAKVCKFFHLDDAQ